MSLIDLFVIVFTLVVIAFSLIGKASKKIMTLCVVIGSILLALALCGPITNLVNNLDSGVLAFIGGESGTKMGDFISNKVTDLVKDFGIPAETITGMVDGIVKMLAFWLTGILLMILLGIISRIVWRIVTHKKRKAQNKVQRRRNTALKTFGLCGLAKGLILSLFLLFPVLALTPILGNMSALVKDNDMVGTLETQINTSKVVQVNDAILTKIKLPCLKYKVGDDERYLYDDFKSIGKIGDSIGTIMDLFNSDDDPLQAIAEMSDDDLRELFENLDEVVSNPTIVEVVEGFIPEELNINVREINFSNEADAFILIKNTLVLDEHGEIEDINLGSITTDNFVEAVAKSDLVEVVAENAGGALADLDEGTVAEIQSKLNAKVGTGEGKISQEKFDNIMKLFEKGE